jgi:metallo-beta-lactamase family protein
MVMSVGAHSAAFDRVPISCLVREHALADGEVRLLGAHSSVTGAMTRVELGGRRILVDCGVPQGAEALDWGFDEAALEVDAVLLTHAHNDHVGNIPTLVERGYTGPIYGTPATLEVTKAVLEEGLGQQGVSAADAAHILLRIEEQLRPVAYDTLEGLGGSVQFAFREAGHILGSASVELISASSRVICSGDLGRPNSPLLRDYNTSWSARRPVDLVLMESTYGDEEHVAHSHADIERELERILQRAVERRGHVLIPAFAIGRTQTLLYHVNNLVESGRIPAIPVAVDSPMGISVSETYADFARSFDKESLDKIARGDDPLDFRNLYAVRRREHSRRLSDMPGPLLIIAGNGMCTGGRIVGHLRRLLPLDQTTVLFMGYQAEGTPGRAIQRAATRGGRVCLDHEDVRVRAEVETLAGLSAHADRRELARWLGAIPGVRQVALHHGEPKAQRSFADWYG